MTIYTTSFGSDTAGAAPSGWTQRWTTSGSSWLVQASAPQTEGKYVRHTPSSSNKRLLSWDSVDGDANRDNGEIFVRFRTSSYFSADQVWLVLRGSGTAGAETAYVFSNINDTSFRISKVSSGTLTSLGTFSFTYSGAVWLGLRFRVNGSALKAKVWNSQLNAEPAAWNLEITDSSVTGAGWIGIGQSSGSGLQDFDDVAVGTNGDTAVFPASTGLFDTQFTALALGVGDPAIRVTGDAALILYGVAPPMRATQYTALPLVEFHADLPVTQTAALVLAEHIPCTTQWAQTWTITRTDGEVFAYTSLDRPLTFRGVVHSPCNSLSATATEQSTTIGASGNMELIGIISDVGISEQELYNGLFDFARFEVWMVPWFNHGGETPFRLMAGTTGTMTHGIEGFKFEVLTASANLRQKGLLEVFTPSCRYGFGSIRDARCPVNLAAITVAGSATSTAVPAASNQATRRIVIDATRAEAAGHFDLGILTWTSGPNAGASSEIKRFESGTFVLWSPLLFPVEVGDTYTATPGCNKSPTDHLRFNVDMLDYGGFPDVPGADSINQFPDSKG